MQKVKKHSLKFTCSNCTYQPDSILRSSKTRKHQRHCNVAFGTDGVTAELPSGSAALQAPEMRRSSIGLRKSGFGCSLDALVPSSSPIWTPPSITPRIPDSLAQIQHVLNLFIFAAPVAAPSLTLQVAPASKFRDATLTSTPLLAYTCIKRGITFYALWFLCRLLGYEFIWYTATGQVLGIE